MKIAVIAGALLASTLTASAGGLYIPPDGTAIRGFLSLYNTGLLDSKLERSEQVVFSCHREFNQRTMRFPYWYEVTITKRTDGPGYLVITKSW